MVILWPSGLTDKRRNGVIETNDVIENILDEFDDLIAAIDKQNGDPVKMSQ